MNDLQLPLLHLFHRLRRNGKGMQLTIEQYDLLRQSLDQGFGLDWESLERVCRLLWVKPSLNYDAEVFRREFAHFKQAHQEAFEQYWAGQEARTQQEAPVVRLGVLPPLPSRRWEQSREDQRPVPEPISPSEQLTEEDGLGAIAPPKLGRPPRKDLQFEPWDIPISLEQVLQTWKQLRRPVIEHQHQDIDIEATIAQINREGFLSDVVMRPLVRKGADLLLLVDEGSGMTPYAPVWQPWVQAIEEQRIAWAQIYNFRWGVGDVLYDWYRPLQMVSLGTVLLRLHAQRSVIVILSDAGAATRSDDAQAVQSMQQWLQQLSRAGRDVIWLNPVPELRWANTSAMAISRWMESSPEIEGVMLPFEIRRWWKMDESSGADSTRSIVHKTPQEGANIDKSHSQKSSKRLQQKGGDYGR